MENSKATMIQPRPFVKWAGGKRQIISEIRRYLPNNFNCYYEPFVGGGALLFDLMPENAIINDLNEELINVYRVLADITNFDNLCLLLDEFEVKHTQEFYYKVRDLDRDFDYNTKMGELQKAARTIYLNKSCFNGLYRVNSKNQFNVPFNQKEKIVTYDRENLYAIHNYLSQKNVLILSGDYEIAVNSVKTGDLVYFDPPYDSVKNSFTGYTDCGFGKEEQERLRDVFVNLDKRGAYVLLSNHNTEYITDLYKDYSINVIAARRNINSNGSGRGVVEEVIIGNY